MIYDKFNNAKLYYAAFPALESAISFAQGFDRSQPDGKYEINARCFAIVSSYQTERPADRKFEAHRKYIDVQILLAGQERLEFIPAEFGKTVDKYDPQTDLEFFSTDHTPSAVSLSEGEFVLLLPEDLHKPNCQLTENTPTTARKMVVKIEI